MIQPVDYEARRSPSQRLPVNPRRHKVAPEQRKRVATACNNCNVRRIKCSGEKPCKQCANSSRECVYPLPNEKVSIARSELEELRRKLDVYERALQDAVPDASARGDLVSQLGAAAGSAAPPPGSPTPSGSAGSPGSSTVAASAAAAHTPASSSAATFSHRPSVSGLVKTEPLDDEALLMSGRLLRDQGSSSTARYMGHTSEAAFLDHIKEFVIGNWPSSNNLFDGLGASDQIIGSLGTYTTLDSVPLGQLDVNPLWLPTPPNMAAMLSTLRSILQDGSSGELVSGGIHYLSDLTMLPLRKAPVNPEDPDLNEYRDLALFNAAFALTCQVTNAKSPNPGEGAIGELFFARASEILENPLDISRCSFQDAATLAMMGLYLTEVGRLERARMYITSALRICEMFGHHQGCADEQSKRVFWTVYILDRWTALLLGRHVSLADEHITVEMPRDAMGMPSSTGLRAHVELARIAGVVATGVRSGADVERAMWLLTNWSANLAPVLHLSNGVSPDPVVCTLHMHYNYLVILAVRPILLNAVKTIVSRRFDSPQSQVTLSSHPQAGHIHACIAAARQSINLARHVLSLTRRKLLRSNLTELFTAALMLLLYDLISGDSTPTEGNSSAEEDEDIEFVVEVHQRVSMTGDKYGSDCVAALRGLQSALGVVKRGQQIRAEDILDTGVFAPRAATGQGFGGGGNNEGSANWMEGDWPMYDGFMN